MNSLFLQLASIVWFIFRSLPKLYSTEEHNLEGKFSLFLVLPGSLTAHPWKVTELPGPKRKVTIFQPSYLRGELLNFGSVFFQSDFGSYFVGFFNLPKIFQTKEHTKTQHIWKPSSNQQKTKGPFISPSSANSIWINLGRVRNPGM